MLIVIGGDRYYKDENEEARSVISRWARRKVASQFREEYLDGRQSFIFSWDEKHRMMHEEAMQHFLDPGKRGYKFEYTPIKPLPKPIEPNPALAEAHTACDTSAPHVEAQNACGHLCRQEFEARGKSYRLFCHPLFPGTYQKIPVISPGLIGWAYNKRRLTNGIKKFGN